MFDNIMNKVVLVTGGASGIGKTVALMFARNGAKVVVSTDKNREGALDTVSRIEAEGGQGLFVKCDVSDEKDVEGMIQSTLDTYGALDYAFNNAGVGPDGVRIPVLNIDECPNEVWDRTVDINLKGVFLCMKHEIKQMRKQKAGVIVNNASVGAIRPVPGFGPYTASKAGVIALTRVAALECASRGIRVNVVCPSMTSKTVLAENILTSDPDKKDEMLKYVPLGRMAEPEEIAGAVLWLCSDNASFITGHIMPVDGGLSAL